MDLGTKKKSKWCAAAKTEKEEKESKFWESTEGGEVGSGGKMSSFLEKSVFEMQVLVGEVPMGSVRIERGGEVGPQYRGPASWLYGRTSIDRIHQERRWIEGNTEDQNQDPVEHQYTE